MKAEELPLVQDVANVLHNLYGNRLSDIILYGSYARGDQNEESDVDFLVILNDNEVAPYKEVDFLTGPIIRLSRKHNKYISVKTGNRNLLEKSDSLFITLVIKEGIKIL